MSSTVILENSFLATMKDPNDPAMLKQNAIHTTEGASRYGFGGALVGGVTLYGWCIPSILQAMGIEWLDHGWIHVMFRRPTYPGTQVQFIVTKDDEGTHHFVATKDDGEACLRGTLGLGKAHWLDTLQLSNNLNPDPVLDNREFLTIDNAPVGEDLRTFAFEISEEYANETGVDAGDIQGLFTGEDPLVHPSLIARQMMPLLAHSYDYGHPAIHVSSHVQNFKRAEAGQTFILTGHFVETYEKRGHHYAICDGALFDASGTEIARIRHTNIYKVAQQNAT